MKMRIMRAMGVMAVMVGMLAVLAGCTTTTNPSGPTTAQTAVIAIQAIVPIGVQYAIAKDPSTAAHFGLAADVLDRALATTNASPAAIMADLNQIDPKIATPEAVLAIGGGLSIYTVFFAGQVQRSEHTSELQSLRQLVCRLLLG